MRAHRPNDESERAKELFAGRFGEEILPSNCSILSQRTATRPTLRVQVARSQTDHLLLLGARRTSAARLERTRRLVVRVRIMQIISIAGRQCTELDTRLATFLSTLLPIEFNRSCPSEHIGLRVRRAHRLDAKRGAHTFLVSHTSGLCKCVRRAATMAARADSVLVSSQAGGQTSKPITSNTPAKVNITSHAKLRSLAPAAG